MLSQKSFKFEVVNIFYRNILKKKCNIKNQVDP